MVKSLFVEGFGYITKVASPVTFETTGSNAHFNDDVRATV
jgi:hypothetical protein